MLCCHNFPEPRTPLCCYRKRWSWNDCHDSKDDEISRTRQLHWQKSVETFDLNFFSQIGIDLFPIPPPEGMMSTTFLRFFRFFDRFSKVSKVWNFRNFWKFGSLVFHLLILRVLDPVYRDIVSSSSSDPNRESDDAGNRSPSGNGRPV